MTYRKRVVVVGAGVLGAACAWALHRRGVEDVLVVDRMGPASGATGVGAGVLAHLAWDPRDVRLAARSRSIYRQLAEDPDPVDLPWHEPGGLTLFGGDQRDRVRRNVRLLRNADVEAAILDPPEVRGLPGGGALELGDVAGGVHVPADGWSLGTQAVRRMLGEAHVHGGTQVRWFDPVARIDPGTGGSGPTVVMRGGDRRVEADHVVVAAGAWTPTLLERSDLPIPVEGYRAQLATVGWSPPEGFPVLHDAPAGVYARPEGPDQLLVGDGTRLDPVRPQLRTEMEEEPADRRFLEEVAEALATRVPDAADGEVRSSWSGIEAATPDRHPIVGADPRCPGLVHLVGGNGFGFMRAPALGEAAAAVVDGDGLPEDVEGYAPDRFEGRWDEDVAPREGFTL